MQVQLRTTVREGSFRRTIIRAMRERRALVLVYTRANGTETTRTVEPYAFTRSAGGDLYFRAMDRKSGESRTWRLDRVAAYALGDAFRLEVPEPKSDASRATAARIRAFDEAAAMDEDFRREHADIARRAYEAALLGSPVELEGARR